MIDIVNKDCVLFMNEMGGGASRSCSYITSIQHK